MTEHFIRHGNILTHVTLLTDPVYLTETLIRTEDFELDERPKGNWLWPCEYVEEITNRPGNQVPNYLPGQNPFLHEFADTYHLPLAAALGGAETTYPEYRQKMKEPAPAPSDPLMLAEVAPAPMPPHEETGPAARPAASGDGDVHLLPVQGNVYMLVGAGGNITVQVGTSGVLLVDTGFAQFSGKILAAVRALSDKPIRYILNTHVHGDHTGGNEKLAGGATTQVAILNTPGESAAHSVQILAHEKVLDRMSTPAAGEPPIPDDAWPTDTYLGNEKELYFNGEAVQMFHPAAAHTDGDSIVYFRRSDVISAGDIFVTTGYPVIDLARGGSVEGEIDGLNKILELAIPAHHEEGGTYVIPGHGRLCDEFDVVEYRDMVAIVRDRVQAMINKGMTLDEVQAARPTRDYDPRYDTPGGFWTAEKFVAAVYKSLKAHR